jgi:hypothetical protein
MHDLISIMKHQNELITNANKKLKEEISDYRQNLYPTAGRGRAKSQKK